MTRLLIVGGLTIDRFADGTSAPGGSVIHSGRAATAEDAEVTILTVAGDEPEAAIGLTELSELGDLIHQRAPSTVTFGHDEIDGRRVLTYLAGTRPIEPPQPHRSARSRAPRSDRRRAAGAGAPRRSGRRATEGDRHPHPGLAAAACGSARRSGPWGSTRSRRRPGVHSASPTRSSCRPRTLPSRPNDPHVEAAALRERLGPHPVLVLTLGAHGYHLDDPAAGHVVASAPRRIVENVSMLGAGDTFGVALAIQLGRGTDAAGCRSGRDRPRHRNARRAAFLGHGLPLIPIRRADRLPRPSAQPSQPALDGEACATDLGDRAAATESEGDVEDPRRGGAASIAPRRSPRCRSRIRGNLDPGQRPRRPMPARVPIVHSSSARSTSPRARSRRDATRRRRSPRTRRRRGPGPSRRSSRASSTAPARRSSSAMPRGSRTRASRHPPSRSRDSSASSSTRLTHVLEVVVEDLGEDVGRAAAQVPEVAGRNLGARAVGRAPHARAPRLHVRQPRAPEQPPEEATRIRQQVVVLGGQGRPARGRGRGRSAARRASGRRTPGRCR